MDSGVYSLFGVVIGGAIALLSPYLTSLYEKRKLKIEIKSDLLYSIGVFYGTLKDHLINLNYVAFANRQLELQGHHTTLYDIDLYKEKQVKSYDKLVELEAKLISLASSIADYYGTERFKSINSIITRIIRESNDFNYLYVYPFSSLSNDQLDVVGKQLPSQLFQKHIETQNTSESIIVEIVAVLKY